MSYHEDITVVIPVCEPDFKLPSQYMGVQTLILSNGGGPLYVQGATLLRVPWQGHARTRKQAIRHIKTPFVFFTVQDAFPEDKMLYHLHMEMLKQRWDILLPRQIPHVDSSTVVQQRIYKWMPPAEEVYSFPQADHVGALYSAASLRNWALADVPIAEDFWWSRGRRVGCVPKARIQHAHERIPFELYLRERAIHRQLKLLQCIERPSIRGIIPMNRADFWANTMEQLGRWGAWLLK